MVCQVRIGVCLIFSHQMRDPHDLHDWQCMSRAVRCTSNFSLWLEVTLHTSNQQVSDVLVCIAGCHCQHEPTHARLFGIHTGSEGSGEAVWLAKLRSKQFCCRQSDPGKSPFPSLKHLGLVLLYNTMQCRPPWWRPASNSKQDVLCRFQGFCPGCARTLSTT